MSGGGRSGKLGGKRVQPTVANRGSQGGVFNYADGPYLLLVQAPPASYFVPAQVGCASTPACTGTRAQRQVTAFCAPSLPGANCAAINSSYHADRLLNPHPHTCVWSFFYGYKMQPARKCHSLQPSWNGKKPPPPFLAIVYVICVRMSRRAWMAVNGLEGWSCRFLRQLLRAPHAAILSRVQNLMPRAWPTSCVRMKTDGFAAAACHRST